MKSNQIENSFLIWFGWVDWWNGWWRAAPSIKKIKFIFFNCGMIGYVFPFQLQSISSNQTQPSSWINLFFFCFILFLNSSTLSFRLGWAPAEGKNWWIVGWSSVWLAERPHQINLLICCCAPQPNNSSSILFFSFSINQTNSISWNWLVIDERRRKEWSCPSSAGMKPLSLIWCCCSLSLAEPLAAASGHNPPKKSNNPNQIKLIHSLGQQSRNKPTFISSPIRKSELKWKFGFVDGVLLSPIKII